MLHICTMLISMLVFLTYRLCKTVFSIVPIIRSLISNWQTEFAQENYAGLYTKFAYFKICMCIVL